MHSSARTTYTAASEAATDLGRRGPGGVGPEGGRDDSYGEARGQGPEEEGTGP